MEGKNRYPNRIEISQFGAAFLKQLPSELNEFQELGQQQKENGGLMNQMVKRRGIGINFQDFASQTQTLIHREVSSIFRVKSQAAEVNESKRKQILHHNNWMNEQKLIKHKLSDTHSRLQQLKFSEYDWRRQSEALKREKCDILNMWEMTHCTRQKRMKSKLKKMLDRKYPNRSESCKGGLLRRAQN